MSSLKPLILGVLEHGPATAETIAARLKISAKRVVRCLWHYADTELLERCGTQRKPGTRGRPRTLYRIRPS